MKQFSNIKLLTFLIAIIFILAACDVTKRMGGTPDPINGDTLIVQSLFNDKSSTISEENIQRILDGSYKLPAQLRVAIVRLDPSAQQRRYYWNDELYLKTQQSYLDLLMEKMKQSPRVAKVSVVPDVLISKSPSFTNIREAAVRMQADAVVIYAIAGDIYSKYKAFARTDIKAFATTQLVILDVRTGLIPFSTVVTKDYLSQKKKEELDNAEATARVQNEAVLLTINEVGGKIADFLNAK